MLFSLALIFLVGICLGSIFNKLKMPQLLGMLITGIILGPFGLKLLDEKILLISSDLRQFALVIILLRAGFNLDLNSLKKVGKSAILMCFVPATLEIIGMIIFAPKFLGLSLIDSAILGTVIAAVSPAVIVPKMLNLIEKKYGTNKSIPQLIMAGASVDDVFVIVLFTSFLKLATTGKFSIINLVKIPISIILGIILGILIGLILIYFFKKIHLRDSLKIVIVLSISFILLFLENLIKGNINFSGLLAIMSIGIIFNQKYFVLSQRLSQKFTKLWVAAELLLFVLVGATVNPSYAISSGALAILLIFVVLIFRLTGVYLSLLSSNLNLKEKIFCMVAYSPKATVQAAIGSIPLTMGLSSGNIILTISVLSILITAPVGAFLIDLLTEKFLVRE